MLKQQEKQLFSFSLIESDLSENDKALQVSNLIQDYCELLIKYQDRPDAEHIVNRIQMLLKERERLATAP
jgi:hypothetical protein